MKLIKKISRFIRKFLKYIRKITTDKDIVILNKYDRQLRDKRITYYIDDGRLDHGYIIKGFIKTENEHIEKSVIFAINFFRDNGVRAPVSETSGLANSIKYGNYRYLPSSPDGAAFSLLVQTPPGAVKCKIQMVPKKDVSPILIGGASVERISGETNLGFVELIASINSYIESHKSTSNMGSADLLERHLGLQRNSRKNKLLLVKAFEYFSQQDHLITPLLGWLAYRCLPDRKLAESVRNAFIKQGHLYLLRNFIDEVNIAPPVGWKYSTRRINNDIANLENGFSMPDRAPTAIQSVGNNVLYLLHNSLPYNSGGYATRSHGLLQGVKKIGNFNPIAVSRPGYPTDHKKYISAALPEIIPENDFIDNIEYLRCDQSVRRSRLTLSEYVEVYADELVAMATKRNVKAIHAASNYPNGLAASLAARRLGIPSIYEVRGLWEITRMSRQIGWERTDQFKFMAAMEVEACRHADRVITITSALKELMVERGVDEDKITVVPNCVHTDRFVPDSIRDKDLSERLGIAKDDAVIGYVGSVVNYEGLGDLIRAVRILVDSGIIGFKLLVVGDGASLPSLKELTVQLNLNDWIIFTGRVAHSEVQKYYSLIDITPFPREPFLVCEVVSPLKPFEALASGKAVIVSSCAALVEIIDDGKTGLVFRKGNYYDLATKLRLLIECSDLRSRLGAAGREWVVQNRDWRNAATIVDSIYDHLA